MGKRLGVVAVVVAVVLLLGWWLLRSTPEGVTPSATASVPGVQPSLKPGAATPPPSAAPPPMLPPIPARDALPDWLHQPEAPKRRVAGHVTFEGKPVAGALVRLEPRPFPAGLRLRETRTSDDGAFDFGEQLALPHAVSASAPGRTGAVVDVDLRDPSASPAPEALELVLTACDARLSGHVFDSGGGAIEHARVRRAGGWGVETNAKGAFELCLPPGQNELRVEADGYGFVRLSVLVKGHINRDVLLMPEAFLVGRAVTYDTGAPVADAVVVAWGSMATFAEGPASATALTGADGRFRLSVSPGQYRLHALSAANAETTSPVTATALVGRLSDEVVLRLRGRSTLRGHVKAAGKPIAGAHVVAIATAGSGHAEAFSQRDGSFVMPLVALGEQTFTASPFEIVAPRRFTVTKPEESVELEVKRMASLHGLVTRLGKPVPGAEVSAGAGMDQQVSTHADTAGRYLLLGLRAGAVSVVAQSERTGAFVEQKLELAPQEDRALDLELASAASIAGRVVSEAGAPVPGAVVVYSSAQLNDMGRSVTDAEGHFVCDQMTGGGEYTPAVYTSEASRTPYSPAGEPLAAVTLADGNSKVEGVTLAIKYERLRISGRVIDPSGAPVPDARVRAMAVTEGERAQFNPWVALPSATTDAQGAFGVEGLTSGTWALNARTPDGAEAEVPSVAAGAKDVVITVHPAGGIDGTLAGYEEAPVVYARAPGQPKFSPAQVEGMTFRVTLPAGTYVVTAMTTREGDAQRVDVKEGVMTRVTMTSHGRAVVTGTVVEHASRAPVPGLTCHVVVRAGDEAGITNWDLETAPKTNAAGEFTADPSPAGDLAVSCFGMDGQVSSGSAQLTVERGGRGVAHLEVVRRNTANPLGDIGVTLGLGNEGLIPLVTAVRPASPAAKAGIAVGDVVVAVDGAPTGPLDAAGVGMLIANHPPGTQVALGLTHGPQPRQVTLTTTPEP